VDGIGETITMSQDALPSSARTAAKTMSVSLWQPLDAAMAARSAEG
jgi:hypothetical protein